MSDVNHAHEKQRRTCAFCSRERKLTAQHIYPRWTHPLLSEEALKTDRVIYWAELDEAGNLERDIKYNNDSPLNLTLKVVCKECNEVFMSGIEDRAKPVAAKLMLGEELSLNLDEQKLISTWIALMAMVSEYTMPKRKAISQETRSNFYQDCHVDENPSPPPNFWAWIKYCDGVDWKIRHLSQSFYLRDNSLPYTVPERKQNTAVVSFGLKRLYFHCIFTEKPIFMNGFSIKGAEQIWPPKNETANWPTQAVCSNYEAWGIAKNLSKLLDRGYFMPSWSLESFESLDPDSEIPPINIEQ